MLNYVIDYSYDLQGFIVKKTAVFLLFTMLIFLSGCSHKEITKYNYLYKGESELWSAECSVVGTGTWTKENNKLDYDNDIKKVLTVTYRNDVSELSNVKNIKIEYEIGSSGGSLDENYDSSNPLARKTLKLQSGGKGISVPLKDTVIKVKITLDDNVQTLELKNVN